MSYGWLFIAASQEVGNSRAPSHISDTYYISEVIQMEYGDMVPRMEEYKFASISRCKRQKYARPHIKFVKELRRCRARGYWGYGGVATGTFTSTGASLSETQRQDRIANNSQKCWDSKRLFTANWHRTVEIFQYLSRIHYDLSAYTRSFRYSPFRISAKVH